jgi:hypothetical protein
MSAAAGQVATVIDRFPAMHIRSFYLPYCLLPRHIENVWQPADEAAYVITPASSFFLDEGQIDQGTKLPCCAGCRFRTSCAGVRPAYLQRFGDAELRAC